MTSPITILDCDGTLVESQHCFDEAMLDLGAKHGIAGINDEFIHTKTRGIPPRISLRGIGVPEEALDGHIAWYRNRAAQIIAQKAEWIPGAEDMLQTLQKAGHILGIVTTAGAITSEAIRKKTRIDQYVPQEWIINGNMVQKHKPDPEGLILMTQILNVSPGVCTYTGDHDSDVKAAKAAKYRKAFLVRGPHTGPDEGKEADHIAKNISVLREMLLHI